MLSNKTAVSSVDTMSDVAMIGTYGLSRATLDFDFISSLLIWIQPFVDSFCFYLIALIGLSNVVTKYPRHTTRIRLNNNMTLVHRICTSCIRGASKTPLVESGCLMPYSRC